MIHSWDNITIKGRLEFSYDAYLVWSAEMQRQLHEYYPRTHRGNTFVVGALQYDVFFDPRYHQDRATFCRRSLMMPSASASSCPSARRKRMNDGSGVSIGSFTGANA